MINNYYFIYPFIIFLTRDYEGAGKIVREKIVCRKIVSGKLLAGKLLAENCPQGKLFVEIVLRKLFVENCSQKIVCRKVFAGKKIIRRKLFAGKD